MKRARPWRNEGELWIRRTVGSPHRIVCYVARIVSGRERGGGFFWDVFAEGDPSGEVDSPGAGRDAADAWLRADGWEVE